MTIYLLLPGIGLAVMMPLGVPWSMMVKFSTPRTSLLLSSRRDCYGCNVVFNMVLDGSRDALDPKVRGLI